MKKDNVIATDASSDLQFEGSWVRDHQFWSGGIVENFADYCTGGKVEAFDLTWALNSLRAYKLLWSEQILNGAEPSGSHCGEKHYHVQHYVVGNLGGQPTEVSHLKFGTNREAASEHYQAILLHRIFGNSFDEEGKPPLAKIDINIEIAGTRILNDSILQDLPELENSDLGREFEIAHEELGRYPLNAKFQIVETCDPLRSFTFTKLSQTEDVVLIRLDRIADEGSDIWLYEHCIAMGLDAGIVTYLEST